MEFLSHLLAWLGGAVAALVFGAYSSQTLVTTPTLSVTSAVEFLPAVTVNEYVSSTTASNLLVSQNNPQDSIDARLVGLLAHVHWLLDRRLPVSHESVKSGTVLPNSFTQQQIDRIYDNQARQIRGVSLASLTNNLATNGFWLSYSGSDSGLYIDSAGRVGIGSASPLERLSIHGGAIFLADFLPDVTTNRLYAEAGSLYWNGSILAGGGAGNWDESGSNVYRLTGNVGIGTSSLSERLTVVGNGLYTGTVTATGFSGSGTLLTSLNASNLSTGVVAYDQLPISSTQVSNWDAAYGWGDHSAQGYINDASIITIGELADVSVAGLAEGDLLRFNGTAFINDVLTSVDIPVLDILTKTSGTLSVARGGTGQAFFTPGQILFGSGTSALATSSNLFWDTGLNRLGIGTTTPSQQLTVVGNFRLTGSLYDSVDNAGTSGFVLQSTGSGVAWVATSTLGVGGGGYGGGNLSVDGYVDITVASRGYRLLGTQVLYASSTNQSTLVGLSAAPNLGSSGVWNTAVGYEALYTATSSDFNTAIGAGSMRHTTSGNENTALGYFSLHLNSAGGFNTGVGYNALYRNTSGIFNVTLGHNSQYNNQAGAFNTTVGASAGYDMNTSAGQGANTLIGYNTGRGITTGVNNTILGANVTGLSADLSNTVIIADGEGNRRIYITSTGNVGIGTTTPTERLTVDGTIQASNLYGGNVDLSTDEDGNIIRKPSDERLKTNVTTISNALETVLNLRGVQYEWIDKDRFGQQLEVGFVAQEVDVILPQVVRKGGEYWALSSSNLTAVLVEAVKQMWSVVMSNQARIAALEARVLELEAGQLKYSMNVAESPAQSQNTIIISDIMVTDSSIEESADEDGFSEVPTQAEDSLDEEVMF